MANKNLNAAKAAKKDEFYTEMTDIERELQHYWPHFRDKVVFCNCDDPYESNFFKYFALHFNHLGLKKLICTCYNGSHVQGNELMIDFGDFMDEPKKIAFKVEITEVKDLNGDGALDLADVRYLLQNDKNVISILKTGDFRDPECIELLKEADIVVTNPPFSLFREYIAQLMEYGKRFLIIGSLNAIHYKEIFPWIKEGRIWLGYGFNAGNAFFRIPTEDKPSYSEGVYDENTGLVKFRNCHWFTNLDHNKRHEELDLVCQYSPEEYPTYANYDAIEVSKVSDIPFDYAGAMGVPTTFLDKFNPDQFEIIGLAEGDLGKELGLKPFDRELKKMNKSLRDGQVFYMKDGFPQKPYSRILIRNKHPKINE